MLGQEFLIGFHLRDPASHGTCLRSQDLLAVSVRFDDLCLHYSPDGNSLPAVLVKISFHRLTANLLVFLNRLRKISSQGDYQGLTRSRDHIHQADE